GGIVPAVAPGAGAQIAMTTAQKSAVAAAAAVFLGSLGYAVRPYPPVSAAQLSPAAVPGTAALAGTPRSRTARPLPAAPGDRQQRLREILGLSGPARRARALLDFLDQLPVAAFPDIAGTLTPQDWTRHPSEWQLVVSAWTRVDPLRAVAWTHEHLEQGFDRTALSCWGEIDPDAAIDWVIRHFPASTDGGAGSRQPLMAVVRGVAARDLGLAVETLSGIPGEQEQAAAITALAMELGDSRPGTMDALLEEVGEGPARSRLIASYFPTLLRDGESERAWKLLLADPQARESAGVGHIFRLWSDTDPDTATAAIAGIPDDALRDEAVQGVCHGTVNRDPRGAFALLWQHPGAADDGTVAAMVQGCTIENVGFGLEQVLRMKDPTLRQEVLAGRLAWWSGLRPDDARRWMDDHDIPAETREEAQRQPYLPPEP
ncbi:hypothetical protein, partial [Luteolibacter marinus]|uniref:hypothetical protein n=1 Tax=Luteolibacter marinus TaxID=2776705 RepID=UPI001D0263C9